MSSDALVARIESLPDESRKVVLTLLDLLAEKAGIVPPPKERRVLNFEWEGGLSGAFEGKTSVDLQHEANKWR